MLATLSTLYKILPSFPPPRLRDLSLFMPGGRRKTTFSWKNFLEPLSMQTNFQCILVIFTTSSPPCYKYLLLPRMAGHFMGPFDTFLEIFLLTMSSKFMQPDIISAFSAASFQGWCIPRNITLSD